MNSVQFKTKLKEIKETLRGKELTVYGYGAKKTFTTLRSFGEYILGIIEKDSKCYIYGTNIYIYPPVDMGQAMKEIGTTV